MGQYHTILVWQYELVKSIKSIGPDSILAVFSMTLLTSRRMAVWQYWHVAIRSIDGPASELLGLLRLSLDLRRALGGGP